MDRPSVNAFLALSLDGYIAGPEGDLSWLDPYATDSIEATGYRSLMDRVDTLVMGRNTFEKLLSFAHWPYQGKEVVVLTHRPLSPRHGETVLAGPLREVLAKLYERGARHVYLDGGQAVRQGLADGLVDQLTLSWVPVILGKGILLFDGIQKCLALQLAEVRHLPSGLVQTIYRPPEPLGRQPTEESLHEPA